MGAAMLVRDDAHILLCLLDSFMFYHFVTDLWQQLSFYISEYFLSVFVRILVI